MTTISTLTPAQYQYLYGKEGVLENQSTMTDTAISIMSGNGTTTSATTNTGSSDNKDDGKIGFFQKVGSFFKGIGKTVVNAVKSLNPFNPKNWGNILKTAACIAVAVVCPPAGVAMACVAGVKGAITVGKGISAAANAKTDAEAEAAWENIGSGTFQVGMSVVGAKAGIKAMKATPGSAMSELGANGAKAGLKATGKAMWKDIKTMGRGGSEATKAAAEASGQQIGYKAAGFTDKISDAYNKSAGTGRITKSIDAVKTGTKEALKETRVGKAYQEIKNSAESAKNPDSLTGRASNTFKAMKQVHKENTLARQTAKDATKGTNNARAAANNAKRSAQQELDAFKNGYKKGADGKWTNGESTLDNAAYTKQLETLESAYKEAAQNSAKVNQVYGQAKTGANVRASVQKQIADKQAALKDATGAQAEQLVKDIKALNSKLDSYSINGKSYATDTGSRAGYDALTGRTSLFRTAGANWKDTATSAGYKSTFASAKPGLATLTSDSAEDQTAETSMNARLSSLGYYVYD